MALSKTAEYVAFYRALETLERRREPLFEDAFASSFLSPALALAARASRAGAVHGLVCARLDRRAPGARLASALRTRLFDDLARECPAQGIRQLVVLGAGFDCRAHRLPELSSTRVFEVDREDMGVAKQRGLYQTPARARDDVHYVSSDLGREAPSDALVRSGWDATLPTLFVCEGVTNYLTEAAVLCIFECVGRAAPRSRFAFSYVDRAVFDGTLQSSDGERLRHRVRELTEPWTFGIAPGEIQTLLARHGLLLREDMTVENLRSRYWGAATISQKSSALYECARIAVADV
jgi:methyltransferase (TIGR00027 family)